jgi:DNA excision repair protein ERCC-2
MALDALGKVRGASRAGLPLRVLELVAKDKSCEHKDKACHGQSCPLASGFYDRLPAAREAAAQAQWLDQAALRAIAREHQVCPYYLGHDMVRWADVVVGDYNYYFDRSGHAVCADGGIGLARECAGGRGAQPLQPCLRHVQRRPHAGEAAGRAASGARQPCARGGRAAQPVATAAGLALQRSAPGKPWQVLDELPEDWTRCCKSSTAPWANT